MAVSPEVIVRARVGDAAPAATVLGAAHTFHVEFSRLSEFRIALGWMTGTTQRCFELGQGDTYASALAFQGTLPHTSAGHREHIFSQQKII